MNREEKGKTVKMEKKKKNYIKTPQRKRKKIQKIYLYLCDEWSEVMGVMLMGDGSGDGNGNGDGGTNGNANGNGNGDDMTMVVISVPSSFSAITRFHHYTPSPSHSREQPVSTSK